MLVQDLTDSPFSKSVRVFEVWPSAIDDLYSKGSLCSDGLPVFPNQPLVLKAGQQSALALVSQDGKRIFLAESDLSFFKIRGRNKEQALLFNILKNPDIKCVVIMGAAGTGKTVCTGAYVLDQILSEKAYDKLILSKPLETVGRGRFLGAVPGSMDDKFSPFLLSYQHMFEGLVGEMGAGYIETMMNQKVIEFKPLELMRGASFRSSVVWFDEAQTIDGHEMETLGSRIDDKGSSKLIISGDLNQRDRNIKKHDTGIWRLVNSPYFLKSPHTACIDLRENMRGPVSQLFYDVFSKEDGS